MGNWFELAIIAFIGVGIAVAIFRGGAANPESTGSLSRKLNKLQSDVSSLRGVKQDVANLKDRVAEIERRGATVEDIRGLEAQIKELATSDAGQTATLDHVRNQVDRLYDFIVKRGMEK